MRHLVTGGAGFIASHVVDRLIAGGEEVAVVDNLSSGRRENVNPQAAFYQIDIRDRDALARVFEEFRPQVVNHHAAQIDVRKSVADPVFDADCNVLGSLNVILESVRTGVKHFIYASTGGAIYGEPERTPADEDHPVSPLAPYGISKHTVEHYLRMYHANEGLRYVALRYANIYGPRQDPQGEAGVMAIFIGRMLAGKRPIIFGDGTATRDYVYVEDAAAANEAALRVQKVGVYNVGTAVETTVLEIVQGLNGVLGTDLDPEFAPPRPGEVQRIALDARLAQRELGWRPTVSFDEGLRLTADWFRGQQAR